MRTFAYRLIAIIATLILLAGCSKKEEVPAGKFPEREIEVPVKGGTLKGTLMEPSGPVQALLTGTATIPRRVRTTA